MCVLSVSVAVAVSVSVGQPDWYLKVEGEMESCRIAATREMTMTSGNRCQTLHHSTPTARRL